MSKKSFKAALAEFEPVRLIQAGYIPLFEIVAFSNAPVVRAVIDVLQQAANQSGQTACSIYLDDLEEALADAVACDGIDKNAKAIVDRIIESAKAQGIEDLTADLDIEA